MGIPRKLNAESSGSVKDPAAVALGKRRIAKMTPEQLRAFHKAGSDALRRRSPLERRLTAQRSALTRRMRPKWMAGAHAAPSGSPGEPPDQTRLTPLLSPADTASPTPHWSGQGVSPGDKSASETGVVKPPALVSELARLLDAASDEALERLRSRLAT